MFILASHTPYTLLLLLPPSLRLADASRLSNTLATAYSTPPPNPTVSPKKLTLLYLCNQHQ